MTLLRQGDVLLQKVSNLPKGLKLRKDNILVYGETTGHKHALATTELSVYGTEDEMFVSLDKPTELVHEEHNTIQVDKGLWKVVRQREYSPSENRRVLD
jgi:hypothetical protein